MNLLRRPIARMKDIQSWEQSVLFGVNQSELRENLTKDERKEEQFGFVREGEIAVERIYTVCPRKSERYYLQTLLLHVFGATSFAVMRTVENEVYPTYRKVSLQRNLFSNDEE